MFSCSTQIWFYYLATDVILYALGIILSATWTYFNKTFFTAEPNGKDKRIQKKFFLQRILVFNKLIIQINKFISGEKISGKCFVFMACFCTLFSLGIYMYEAFYFPQQVEVCFSDYNRMFLYYMDLACNCFFLFFFICRLLADEGRLSFWMNKYTLSDILTVPHSFVGLVFLRYWTGFRFLRSIWLIKLPDFCQYFDLMKSSLKLRFCQMISIFLCVYISGAGALHLLENSGDPWIPNGTSIQTLTYGECLYAAIVTMSTVGYGDIVPKTSLGRMFICIFIMMAFAMFASFVPQIVDILFSGSAYTGDYEKGRDTKHIVITGNIIFPTVQSFLEEFFHEDREKDKVEVVFLNSIEPEYELDSFLKRNQTQVKYFKGTVMDPEDIKRVSMGTAEACLILADQNCANPNEEDAANILRVIALKKKCPDLRIIVQLLQHDKKYHILNLSGWNKDNGDEIICYSELHLGMLAKSCSIPGYSTFISNLFSLRSQRECQPYRNSEHHWTNAYLDSLDMELYRVKLSPHLQEMIFNDLVMFFYNDLQLLLIAVEIHHFQGVSIFVNPTSNEIIPKNSFVYLICGSYMEAKRAMYYCPRCHGLEKDKLHILEKVEELCDCRDYISDFALFPVKQVRRLDSLSPTYKSFRYAQVEKAQYETEPQEFNKIVIRNPHEKLKFSDHILICIFAKDDSPPIGLKKLIQPLRSTMIKKDKLRQIVIVSNEKYLLSEWWSIETMSNIQPIVLRDIRMKELSTLCVESCHICIILSSKPNEAGSYSDQCLVDKEAILTTLNITSYLKQAKSSTKFQARLITNLIFEQNVSFLSHDSSSNKNYPMFMSHAFASGQAFTKSFLDSLFCTAFFNKHCMLILQILTEGISKNYFEINKIVNGNCSKMKLISFKLPAYDRYFKGNSRCDYVSIVTGLFREHQILLLGVYRSMNKDPESECPMSQRVIITNPKKSFLVYRNDFALALKPILSIYDAADSGSVMME